MEKSQKDNIRPPIVAILGHVDHGKTTLLDTIRKTNIVAREHGGITQHIGAYQINYQGKLITFIDTPGHAAFEKMRARGAEVADIAVLVVAANESVKPQTIEAINHIKKANILTVVAITKTDLDNVNIERVKKELQKEGIVAESYGGDVPVVNVAAPKNKGISELLEVIQLVWQISPQPSLKNDPLEAVVVESFLDQFRGPIVSVIIKRGTLNVGQKIEVDNEKIKVRSLVDDNGRSVEEAPPGKPVEILGFKKVLEVGSIVRQSVKTKDLQQNKAASHADIIAKSQEAKDKFKVIIKADTLGSKEAIIGNLPEKILVISSAVGEVRNNDVSFAKASKAAPILAFNVKIPSSVQKQADQEHVVIRSYNVIYKLIEDMQDVVKSFEQTKHEIKVKGKAQIVATFDIEGKKIAGVKVTSGKIKIGDKIILRTDDQEKESEIVSLKKFRKEVESATAGQECGIGFLGNLDFREGNVIESLG